MLITFLDTSALFKKYVQEKGSEDLRELWFNADIIGSALITRVEMAAALAKAERMKWINSEEAEQAWEEFLLDWRDVAVIEIEDLIVTRASNLAWDFGLRGYDAMHLATALVWGETLNQEITLSTFDRQLWQAAKRYGLPVWPEDLSVYF